MVSRLNCQGVIYGARWPRIVHKCNASGGQGILFFSSPALSVSPWMTMGVYSVVEGDSGRPLGNGHDADGSIVSGREGRTESLLGNAFSIVVCIVLMQISVSGCLRLLFTFVRVGYSDGGGCFRRMLVVVVCVQWWWIHYANNVDTINIFY